MARIQTSPWWAGWRDERRDRIILACGCGVSLCVLTLTLCLLLANSRRRRRQARHQARLASAPVRPPSDLDSLETSLESESTSASTSASRTASSATWRAPAAPVPVLLQWKMVFDAALNADWMAQSLAMRDGLCVGAGGRGLAFSSQFLLLGSELLFAAYCVNMLRTIADPFVDTAAATRLVISLVFLASAASAALLVSDDDFYGESILPVCHTDQKKESAGGADMLNLVFLYVPLLSTYFLSVVTVVHASVVLGTPLTGFDMDARSESLRGLREFVFMHSLSWGLVLVLYVPLVVIVEAPTHALDEERGPLRVLFGTFLFVVGARSLDLLPTCRRLLHPVLARKESKESKEREETQESSERKERRRKKRAPLLNKTLQADVLHYCVQGMVALLAGGGHPHPVYNQRSVTILNPYQPPSSAADLRVGLDDFVIVGNGGGGGDDDDDDDDDDDVQALGEEALGDGGADALEHSATALEHGTTALEHSATALEHGTTALEHSATALEHGTTALEHSATALENGAAALEQPLLGSASVSISVAGAQESQQVDSRAVAGAREQDGTTPELVGAARELDGAARNRNRKRRKRQVRVTVLAVSPLIASCSFGIAFSLGFKYHLEVTLVGLGFLVLSLLLVLGVWRTSRSRMRSRFRAIVTERHPTVLDGVRGTRTSSLVRSLQASLAPDAATQFQVSEGRSGAFLFFTSDRVYLVKTLTPSEMLFLESILADLARHWRDQPSSSIARLLGVFTMKCYGRLFNLVVMENVVPVRVTTFDLKGSWVDRSARQPKVGSLALCKHCSKPFVFGAARHTQTQCRLNRTHEPWRLLKDNDFHAGKVLLPLPLARKLKAQLRRDAAWLADHGIMDYSLLLGVRNSLLRFDATAAPSGFGFGSGSAAAAASSHSGTASESASSPTAIAASAAAVQYEWQQVDDDAQHIRSGRGAPALLVKGPAFYHLGIIDFLQQYTVGKRLERLCKTYLLFKGEVDEGEGRFPGLSATDPATYRDRFVARAVDNVIVELGDLVQVVRRLDGAPLATLDVSVAHRFDDLWAMVEVALPTAHEPDYFDEATRVATPLTQASFAQFRLQTRDAELTILRVSL